MIDISSFIKNNDLKVIEEKYHVFEEKDSDVFLHNEVFWPHPQEADYIEANKEEIEKYRIEKYTPAQVQNKLSLGRKIRTPGNKTQKRGKEGKETSQTAEEERSE